MTNAKHKILDHFRKHKRMILSEDLETREQDPHAYLDRKGTWKVGQSEWITQPEKACGRKEFWKHLNLCLEQLNDRHRDVYTMWELQNRGAEEICEVLDLSRSNLWVCLYRARLQLREGLTKNGFRPDGDA